MTEEKQLTWDDIEKQMRDIKAKSPVETDKEKLEYFKKKILGHLDNLQEEINKEKIIPFPKQPYKQEDKNGT